VQNRYDIVALNVHVYPSNLTHESRILRITDALVAADIFDEVEVVGVARTDLPEREKIDDKRTLVRIERPDFNGFGPFLSKVMITLVWSLNVFGYLRKRRVGCVNAHSLAVLPLCVIVAYFSKAKLVYDTHELETETSGYKGIRQSLGRIIERTLIKRCDLVFVVSDSIADWYAKTYDIVRPTVVRNIPQFTVFSGDLQKVQRTDIGVPADKLLFIYQGGFISGRGVERLLSNFSKLPELELVCMGSGPLQHLVEDAAANFTNIHYLPPVPPREVLAYTRVADVGICLTDNSCLSHYYSLPNKVFEYLHAGLPIIVNPLLEQTSLVREFDCGWMASERDADFIKMLSNLRYDDILTKKRNARSAAEKLQWSDEAARLIAAYREFRFV
jgi:glycosyltransferase involved in cell wall biosynthesis